MHIENAEYKYHYHYHGFVFLHQHCDGERWGAMEPFLDLPHRGLCPEHFGQDCRMTVDKVNART